MPASADDPLRELLDTAIAITERLAYWHFFTTQPLSASADRAKVEEIVRREIPALARLVHSFRRLIGHPEVRRLRALHSVDGVEMGGVYSTCWIGMVGQITKMFCIQVAMDVAIASPEEPPAKAVDTVVNAVLIARRGDIKVLDNVNVSRLQMLVVSEYQHASDKRAAEREKPSGTAGIQIGENMAALSELQHTAVSVYRAIARFNVGLEFDQRAMVSEALNLLEGEPGETPTIIRLGKLIDNFGHWLPTCNSFSTGMGPIAVIESTACKAALGILGTFLELLLHSFAGSDGKMSRSLAEAFLATWEESRFKFSSSFKFPIQAELSAINAVDREIIAAKRLLNGIPAEGPSQVRAIGSTKTKPVTKAKRCTQRGEAKAKLIGALTKWHDYANGGCLNQVPARVRQLAKLADVDPSTASDFFKREFKGLKNYKTACAEKQKLVAALKLLNEEFAPHHFLHVEPSNRREREHPDDRTV